PNWNVSVPELRPTGCPAAMTGTGADADCGGAMAPSSWPSERFAKLGSQKAARENVEGSTPSTSTASWSETNEARSTCVTLVVRAAIEGGTGMSDPSATSRSLPVKTRALASVVALMEDVKAPA